jgi:uncharacterized membrane protein
MQKARLPSPTHPSHQRHRRELWTRILIPMLAAVAAIVALATLTGVAAFRPQSEVARWAAVSTTWIILPIMAAALLLLVVLIALIYGMARLLAIIPAYTGQAQNIAWRIEETVKRLADGAAKPIFALEGITATIKRLAGMK